MPKIESAEIIVTSPGRNFVTLKIGYMHPGDKPGRGVDIDEKAAAKYLYERAHLPVNRLEDGTWYNWSTAGKPWLAALRTVFASTPMLVAKAGHESGTHKPIHFASRPTAILPRSAPNDLSSAKGNSMPDLKPLHDAILTGDAKNAKAATETALAAGIEAMTLVQETMMPAMDEVGRRFERNEYFVPELLLSARAMKAALELIRPLLAASGVEPVGRVAIGTNLVAAMLEGGGYEIIDLGVNVDPAKFVAAVKEKKARIVALSALLTTTMPAMKTTIDALKQAGVRDQVKVMIGGAPVSEAYAKEIGADGYSKSAAGAVAAAREL
jgi:5-methyltetrahydrofolate--homocysteine methyltransferase